MKFISLAVMALLGSAEGIHLNDMEADDQIGAEVATQLSE
jgi:hypothetical protein